MKKMYKKITVICMSAVVVGTSIFTGCTRKNNTNPNVESGNVTEKNDDNSAEKVSQDIADTQNLENENSGKYAYKFNVETDCQSDQGEAITEAYTSAGYYSLNALNNVTSSYRLDYYDYSSKQSIPVCTKANCQHNDKECDAYFLGNEYPVGTMWYYEGNLYMPSVDGDYLCITKISSDGSTREKVCSVARVVDVEDENGYEAVYYPTMILHRGEIYYTDCYPGCKKAVLYKKSLDDSSKPKTIDTIEGDNVLIYRMKGYGNNIFFQRAEFGEDGDVTDGGIYVYNTKDATEAELVKGAVSSYCLDEAGNIYYYDNSNKAISRLDTDGQTDTFYEFGDEDNNGFLCDGDRFLVYVTTDSKEKQYIVDTDGNITKTITKRKKFEKPYQSIRDK